MSHDTDVALIRAWLAGHGLAAVRDAFERVVARHDVWQRRAERREGWMLRRGHAESCPWHIWEQRPPLGPCNCGLDAALVFDAEPPTQRAAPERDEMDEATITGFENHPHPVWRSFGAYLRRQLSQKKGDE